jgi:hypothetical protein
MSLSITRFSLRAFLGAMTGLCCFLVYEVNWIHQRRQFLAEQRVKGPSWLSVNKVSKPSHGTYRRGPNWLEWFGERGYHPMR